MRRISVPTCRRPTSMPCRRSRSRSMRLPANGCSRCNSSMRRISARSRWAHRLGVVVHRAAADAQQLGLALDRQFVVTVDHRFALSSPALLSAPSKKSFSSVNCPILACSALRSTGGARPGAAGRRRRRQRAPATGASTRSPGSGGRRASARSRQSSCRRAKASTATLALNAGEWFRRGLLLICSAPVISGSILAHRSSLSTFSRVQFCAATSPRAAASLWAWEFEALIGRISRRWCVSAGLD